MHDVFVYVGDSASDNDLVAVARLRHGTEHTLGTVETGLIDFAGIHEFETQTRGAMSETADILSTTDRGDDLRRG